MPTGPYRISQNMPEPKRCKVVFKTKTGEFYRIFDVEDGLSAKEHAKYFVDRASGTAGIWVYVDRFVSWSFIESINLEDE